MFCEPKGQELNTFSCKKRNSDFLTPLGPLGVLTNRFEKLCLIRMCADLMSKSNLTLLRKDTQTKGPF